ncbi:MAG TPA: FAD-dependent oxidoreductase [Chloroflexia bacterium]|nr:FAD-dependent oxidoreductase [Chloroflexia bacterium]
MVDTASRDAPGSARPPPVVVGGGMAGIVAALHLAERGVPPLVLEADPTAPGGRLAGGVDVVLDAGGQPFRFPGEHGIHAIWGQYRNLTALLQRYGLYSGLIPAHGQEWIDARRGRVRYAELGSAVIHSPVPAPFHYLPMFIRPRFLAMLGPRDYLYLPAVLATILVAVGTDPIGEELPMAGKTMADLTGDWSPTVQAFIGALARSGLSDYPQNVPLSGFIAFLRFYTLLRRDSQAFSYFPTAPVPYMIGPWVDRIRALGGAVHLGRRVTCLEQTADGWRVTWHAEPDGVRSAGTILAQDVVLAVDAPAAAQLLATSPGTAAAAAALRYPGGLPTGTIRLWWGRRPRRGAEAGLASGDFIVDNFFWLDRIQPAFAAWAAVTGGSAVEVQIYGPPDLLDQPEEVLLARAQLDVERAYPELRGSLIRGVAWRNPAVHTLFAVGTAAEHLGVMTPWPGLVACGDWLRHPVPAFFLERATVTALAAANAVLAAHDRAPWAILPPVAPEPLAQAVERGIRRLRRTLRAARGR